jgi:hypothetical protein
MTQQQETTSLRWVATTDAMYETADITKWRFLAATSAIAIAAMTGMLASAMPTLAQTADDTGQPKPGSQLPPIQVTAPEAKRHANSAASRADRGGPRRRHGGPSSSRRPSRLR